MDAKLAIGIPVMAMEIEPLYVVDGSTSRTSIAASTGASSPLPPPCRAPLATPRTWCRTRWSRPWSTGNGCNGSTGPAARATGCCSTSATTGIAAAEPKPVSSRVSAESNRPALARRPQQLRSGDPCVSCRPAAYRRRPLLRGRPNDRPGRRDPRRPRRHRQVRSQPGPCRHHQGIGGLT